MAASPRQDKGALPYPAFPGKRADKSRRHFPVESDADFKLRLEIMAAYLGNLVRIAAKFRTGRDHFMYGGRKVDKRAVNSLFSQLGRDIKDLSGFYKAAKSKARTRKGAGGFALPSLASDKMLNFLRGANLGALYNQDGTSGGQSLKDSLAFLNDPNYNGVVGGGVLMALMSVYAKNNGLTARATTNQGRPADQMDGNWLGVDQDLASTFAAEIQAGVAEGQRRLALEQAAGGGEGQPRRLTSDGKPAKAAVPLKSGAIRETQKFYAFDPNNFRWSDFFPVFVTPNVSKDRFRSVNPNADRFFPASLTTEQQVQISNYEDAVKAADDAGMSGMIDYLALAAQASGASGAGDVFNRNAPLFARAQNSQIQQVITNSKNGLKKSMGQ